MGPISVLIVTLLLSVFLGFLVYVIYHQYRARKLGIRNASWLPSKRNQRAPFRAVEHDDETWDANAEEVGLRRTNPFDDEHAEHVENPFDDPRETPVDARKSQFKEDIV